MNGCKNNWAWWHNAQCSILPCTISLCVTVKTSPKLVWDHKNVDVNLEWHPTVILQNNFPLLHIQLLNTNSDRICGRRIIARVISSILDTSLVGPTPCDRSATLVMQMLSKRLNSAKSIILYVTVYAQDNWLKAGDEHHSGLITDSKTKQSMTVAVHLPTTVVPKDFF